MTKLAETLNEVKADRAIVKSHLKPRLKYGSALFPKQTAALAPCEIGQKTKRTAVVVYLGASFSQVTQRGLASVLLRMRQPACDQNQLTNIRRETGQKPPGGGLITAGQQQCVWVIITHHSWRVHDSTSCSQTLVSSVYKLLAVVTSMCCCARPHITARWQGHRSFW